MTDIAISATRMERFGAGVLCQKISLGRGQLLHDARDFHAPPAPHNIKNSIGSINNI